ncbi:MAG: trigger factor [Candidatus Paceibacterota bacterium]
MYENINVEKNENAEVVITGQIPLQEVENRKKKVLSRLAQDMEIPGFRKGHVPQHVAEEKLGVLTILQDIAEEVLQESYPILLKEHKIDAVGHPHVSLTMLVPGTPIGFSINTAIMPEVRLGEYKKEAGKVRKENEGKEISVSDQELNDTLTTIRKSLAGSSEKGETANLAGEEELPELNEENVKKLGDFKNVDDLKAQLRERMQKEKEMREKEKVRIAIIDKLIETSEVPVPSIFIESELDKMLAEFRSQVSQMGLSFEEYLKRTEKTEEKMREEWRNEAEKRAKMQLILNEIAKVEEIIPDEDRLEREVKHILEHHSDADPMRVRAYVENMLTNEKVFELLEGNIDKIDK